MLRLVLYTRSWKWLYGTGSSMSIRNTLHQHLACIRACFIAPCSQEQTLCYFDAKQHAAKLAKLSDAELRKYTATLLTFYGRPQRDR